MEALIMDWQFMLEVSQQLLAGLPLTINLTVISLIAGFALAGFVYSAAHSSIGPVRWIATLHIEVFRGTPLLLQIFLIYYGLSQIPMVRHSFLWPFLREPYWCVIFALALNTSAYTAEIIRGAIQAVPQGEVEAARSCGMSGLTLRRRIIWPIALRQGLPVYGSEVIQMVKATSLASIVTLSEVTGITYKLVSSTYRVIEIFAVAGAIYLALNFVVSIGIMLLERSLNAHLAHRRS
jgi:octopine/nopaline transport system permease protein